MSSLPCKLCLHATHLTIPSRILVVGLARVAENLIVKIVVDGQVHVSGRVDNNVLGALRAVVCTEVNGRISFYLLCGKTDSTFRMVSLVEGAILVALNNFHG